MNDDANISPLPSPNYNRSSKAHQAAHDAPPTPSSQRGPGVSLHREVSEPMAISITVNPVTLVTTECVTITSAMRKHGRLGQSSVSAILGGTGGKLSVVDTSRPSSRNGISVDRKKGPRIGGQGTSGLNGDHTLAGRWGLRGQRGKSQQDNPLMSAFAQLRRELSGCKDIQSFDAPALLHPFLQVIRSSSTSAAITSLAVIAVTKFFAYNLITLDSPRISLAMQLLSAAVTHCRFEASDSSADEIVLLRILKLMESVLSRPEGRVLGDQSVCEMMETGLSMCCQSRLSEVLRRSAEIAMISMCQVIFGRLKTLDLDEEAEGISTEATVDVMSSDRIKMDPSIDGDSVVSPSLTRSRIDTSPASGVSPTPKETNGPVEDTTLPPPSHPDESSDGEEEVTEDKPYGLPSIRELFRVLIDLLDPHNRQHTDPMRIMALRIIDVTLEVAGPWIARHSSLSQLAKDDLCRHLFQLVRSENMYLLNGSLRVAGTLLQTCRQVLKLQQELFLSYLVACLHPRVDIPPEPGIDPSLYEGIPQAPKLVKPVPSQSSSGRSTPVPVKDRQNLGLEGGSRRPEARESMVESIGALVRMPTFMSELFVNYDCEVDRADLCEDMVGLLSRNAFPDSATWSTTNVPPLCLDALLCFVQFMAERLGQDPVPRDRPDLARLRLQRERKKIIIQGATRFNHNPKAGIAYLASNGIILNPDDPLQTAQICKGTSRISKKVLGDFISKKSNENVLEAFISLFDFEGKRIDEALRLLLGSFRLPGESQLIERIVTVFVERYCSDANASVIADKDAAFVLTYGIIMLNTDLYNPNVKSANRMSYVAFGKNLRGVNAGKDFEPEYMQAIYDSIKQNEIILPDEHDNRHAFEYTWKELLIKTTSVGDLHTCETSAYDGEMFAATWRPIVATLCYVFIQASDDAVYSRVVNGFDQCAQIAARYGVVDAFDRIVSSLCTISTLATERTTALNTEVQAGKKKVMVSELAVHFGRDFRAQLATVLLFRIIQGNEAALQESWIHVIKIFQNLFVNSLVNFPPEGVVLNNLSPIVLQSPSQIIDRDGRMNDSGLLSAFTSYLSSYAAGDPPEPTDEELENTLCTVDCINACQLEDVFHNMLTLPAEFISSLVNVILSQLPDEAPPIVVVKPDRPPPSPQPNGPRSTPAGLIYSPGMVFLIELATSLVLRDKETVASAGESLTAYLQSLIRDASNLHSLVAVRVVHHLLSLLRASYNHDFMRAPVVLHAISSFDDATLHNTASPVIEGLSATMITADPLRNEIANSPDFWSILQRLYDKEQAEQVFEILQTTVEADQHIIAADNYESAISLANDFATAASQTTQHEKRGDQNPRRVKAPPKQVKPQDNALVARGTKAMSLIYRLTHRIPELISKSHLEQNEAWATYWSPVFRTLTTQCVNPCREVRHQALSYLQRSLLSPDLASNSPKPQSSPPTSNTETETESQPEWVAIFYQVLFPLLLRLLKPEIYALDPYGMNETRTQAATLLCRVFLHHLDNLAASKRLSDVWLKVLDVLDRLMNSGQQQQQQQQGGGGGAAAKQSLADAGILEEQIPENLKNCLLVMADSGYLVPPPPTTITSQEGENGQAPSVTPNDGAQQQEHELKPEEQIWEETRKRVHRFLPSLFDTVFPEQATVEKQKEKERDGAVVEDKKGSGKEDKREKKGEKKK